MQQLTVHRHHHHLYRRQQPSHISSADAVFLEIERRINAVFTVAHSATLTLQSLEARGNVTDYIHAARACEGKEDIITIWQQIMDLQNDTDFEDFPSPFVYVLDSSGTGKTQLAATTGILKDKCDVKYFYTGDVNSENLQRFYTHHVELWGALIPLLEDLRIQWRVGADLPGASAILRNRNPHALFRCFNKIFFDCDDDKDMNARKFRAKIIQSRRKKPLFVFLDEVPTKDKFLNAIILRDCLRAAGVVPILMSTHSGAHNAIPRGGDSRGDDVPQIWCQVISKLPANHAFQKHGVAVSTERPLVYDLCARLKPNEQNDLSTCVKHVRKHFRTTKPQAWDNSSLFQLCQLFRSSADEDMPMNNSHRLVGHHFGHFEIESNLIKRTEIDRFQASGKVRLPIADEEPILFLALTAWWEEDMHEYFPLCDGARNALSVRSVFDRNRSAFFSEVESQNSQALKLNGDLLEILSLASVTLASLRSDAGLLCGVTLVKFIATVFCLLRVDPLTKQTLNQKEEEIEKLVDYLPPAISTIQIPAFPSAESSFSQEILRGRPQARLKRPPDQEQRDGCIIGNSGDIVHIECKMYKDGLSTSVFQKIIERFRAGCKIHFIFTSKVNGLWQSEKAMDDFLGTHGLKFGDLAILVLSDNKPAHWLSSLNGKVCSPSERCEYLAIIFAIGVID